MKHLYAYIILVFIFISACNKNKSAIITYDLKRSDYIETIDAAGTIQAVNNFAMMAPRTNLTNILKVTYLAEDGAHVKKGDTICIFDEPNLFSFLEQVKRELQTMEGELMQLEANNAMRLSLLNAQVETNKAQIAISMLDSIQIKFAPPVKQRLLALEMEKANIEKTNSQPIRTRIRYSYKSYHRVQRFKQDFKKTDAKLIRALLPLYRMKINGGFKN